MNFVLMENAVIVCRTRFYLKLWSYLRVKCWLCWSPSETGHRFRGTASHGKQIWIFCNVYIREMIGSCELAPAEDVLCGYRGEALRCRGKANYLSGYLGFIQKSPLPVGCNLSPRSECISGFLPKTSFCLRMGRGLTVLQGVFPSNAIYGFEML